MDRKGQLGKIVTTFGVMFFIFLVLATYLILAGFVFGIKGQDKDFRIDGVGDLDDGIFKRIEIEGERMSVIHGLMRARIEGGNGVSYVRDSLAEEMKVEDGMCFLLCQNCLLDIGFSVNMFGSNRGFGDPGLLSENIFIRNGEKVYNGVEAKKYSEVGLDNKLKINFERNGMKEEFNMVYYYGECLE